MPYVPKLYDYEPSSRISELMLLRGQQRAAAIQRAGDIWAGTLGNLGNLAAEYLSQREENKSRQLAAQQKYEAEAPEREYKRAQTRKLTAETEAMEATSKRQREQDATFMELLNQNPSAADVVSNAYKIYGPERGSKVAAGYVSFQEMGEKRGEEALKSLPHIIDGFEAMGEAGRAQTWPFLRQKVIAAGLFNEQLPEEYTPEMAPDIIKFGEGLKGNAKAVNLQHVETDEGIRAFDPATGTLGPVLARGKRPEGPQSPVAVLDEATGQAVYVRPSEALGRRPAPSTTARETTEDERKTSGYFTQMQSATAIMDELEGKLSQKELYQIQTLPQEGIVGMLNRGELSETAKRYLRAFEQFTEARLRPVSGAAIADSEYERDRRTYAKQYGETAQLSVDRKQARDLALDALRQRAGRALTKVDQSKTRPRTAVPQGAIEAFARERGISVEEARKLAESEGYVVVK